MNFDQLLKFSVDQHASDLHLQAGSIPMLRIGRGLRGIEGAPVDEQELRAFLESIIPPGLAADLDAALRQGLSFAHEVPGIARLRGQLAAHMGTPSATLRLIPREVPSFEALNLPPAVKEVALGRRGLVLIVGEATSGRTTTLAAMVEAINAAMAAKIITIEAPVEFAIPHRKSLVSHRLVPRDAPSIAEALKRVVREDPDVVAIGELTDPDSLRLALRLADADHLVIAVCEGSGTLNAIERLLALAPAAEQKTALRLLATSLEAIIAQRMAVTRAGKRRPAFEILRGGPYVTRALTEGRSADLATYMTGRQGGMQTFDQHLVELNQAGEISGTEALRLSNNTEAVALQLRSGRTA